jgi:asparagine synthase (glutamine-hydrolysing)
MMSAMTGHADETDFINVLTHGAIGVKSARNSSLIVTADERVFVLVGTPEWTTPQLHDLCAEGGAGRALAKAYDTRGTDFFQDLHGAFALAIIDSGKREAIFAVDRFGLQTLRYGWIDETTFAFASQCDALCAHPDFRAEVSAQQVFDYLHFNVIPGEETIYSKINKLLPGHYITYSNEKIEVRPYFKLQYDHAADRDCDSLSKELFENLRRSVRQNLTDCVPEQTGVFLSGGLDSSTVLGLATEALGKPIKSFTTSFDTEAFNEFAYAANAAEHFKSPHTGCPVSSSETADLIPKIAEVYDEPFGNSSAVPTYYCAKVARDHGVAVMLAGDGGDELFAGNERYVLQQKLALYSNLPSPLRAALEGLIKAVPSSFQPGLMTKARGYVSRAKIPMPERLQTYNLLQPGILVSIFEGDFLSSIDPNHALETLQTLYRRYDSPSLLHRMMHLDLQLTLADNDLRKVIQMCELAGVEAKFPFLHEGVVEFAACIPPELLIHRWRLRYFYKQAMRSFLPKETIEKEKHGFALPFRIWMERKGPLRDLIGDTLSQHKRRGIVNPAYLDSIIDDWDAEEARIYAPFVWSLTILELWLQKRRL